ncbi:YwhD family protein [Paenibacillus aurantius]|uniref:YwhD family protein n=1 Tax=Paenibacillus aurantius TaxID=2918900 RepID=A0AA96LFC1_9BACL|nr:YwhD family protein [Paenibacillus aurantius]WNQ11060.1 YwhD family protein [Paenibacillus aurantius]
MELNSKGKKLALNIVSSNVNHKGFGAGSIDLSNVSSVIIDGDEAYLDNGALHAKSKVEKGIKFSTNKEDVPNGRKCWIVWVAVDRSEEGQFYGGIAACEMLVDPEARKGWKILADHVNRMDKAMKRQILVDGLDEREKAALRRYLTEFNLEWWERSSDTLKEALA